MTPRWQALVMHTIGMEIPLRVREFIRVLPLIA